MRDKDELKVAMESASTAFQAKVQHGVTQWSPFGLCSTSCGRGVQKRSRTCKPGMVCTGSLQEIRACIEAPCPGRLRSKHQTESKRKKGKHKATADRASAGRRRGRALNNNRYDEKNEPTIFFPAEYTLSQNLKLTLKLTHRYIIMSDGVT